MMKIHVESRIHFKNGAYPKSHMSRKLIISIMNKSHATMFLTRLVGEADGEWSKDEINQALLLGGLAKAHEEAPDWGEKIISGELNEQSAIYILNQVSKDEQMDCLLICLITACADGELDAAEIKILARILSSLNKGITVEELVESHKNHLNNLN